MTDLVYAASVPARRRSRVVYVGITDDLERRIREHQQRRTGPHKVYARCEWTVLAECATREEAEDVERALIRRLKPECNGRVEPPSWWLSAWRRVAGWVRRAVRVGERGCAVIGVVAMMWWLLPW